MCDMFSMKGKVAVVTGGARGLGYDMAAALCEAGATVCITSRRLDSAVASAAVLRRDFASRFWQRSWMCRNLSRLLLFLPE